MFSDKFWFFVFVTVVAGLPTEPPFAERRSPERSKPHQPVGRLPFSTLLEPSRTSEWETFGPTLSFGQETSHNGLGEFSSPEELVIFSPLSLPLVVPQNF